MEGEKEGMDRDRHDLRMNQDGYQQDLLEKENTSHLLYSVVAHMIKQDKGGLVIWGVAWGQGLKNLALTLAIGTGHVLMKGPQVPLTRHKENDCFNNQEIS